MLSYLSLKPATLDSCEGICLLKYSFTIHLVPAVSSCTNPVPKRRLSRCINKALWAYMDRTPNVSSLYAVSTMNIAHAKMLQRNKIKSANVDMALLQKMSLLN